MNPSTFTREGVPVYNTLTAQDVDPFNPEEAVKSQLPLLDRWEKTDYLSYRACGFSVREAAAMVGIGQRVIMHWRRDDPDFRQWEGERLPELQGRIADTLLRNQFMRNMHLVFSIDHDQLKKAKFLGLKNMDEVDRDWASDAAKRYKSQDLAMLLKALEPERDISSAVTVNVNLDGKTVEGFVAKQAAMDVLMQRFTRNREMLIEGEVVDGSPST